LTGQVPSSVRPVGGEQELFPAAAEPNPFLARTTIRFTLAARAPERR